jgi:hypothetical protein
MKTYNITTTNDSMNNMTYLEIVQYFQDARCNEVLEQSREMGYEHELTEEEYWDEYRIDFSDDEGNCWKCQRASDFEWFLENQKEFA